MLEFQQKIDERYCALRDARSGPVFFIEHGLDEAEVAAVVADTRRSLKVHRLESGWWQSKYLPLLVVATEAGYRYRGSGTDFWPVLEDELSIQFAATDRQTIRDFFVSATNTYRGARPPLTPWAEAFHLIAWPITHALVPLEFHRPLAQTLANLRLVVGSLSDDALYQSIRGATASNSARFSTLLEDSAVVVAVTKSLLGVVRNGAELCPEVMKRIATDLATDQVARRGVAVARQIQRTAGKSTAPPGPDTQLPSIAGLFRLRRRDKSIVLEAILPPLQADLQTRLRRALRRRRYAASLWGVSARTPSEQFLSGLPFEIKLTRIPAMDAELFPVIDEADIDQEIHDMLDAFTLNIAPPLLFAVNTEEEFGRQVRGLNISGHRKYWLLCEPGQILQGGVELGRVGPFECRLLDPSEEDARQVLHELGYQLRFGVSVEFAGSPPFDRDAPTPVFVEGDRRCLVAGRSCASESLTVELGGERVDVSGDDVVTMVVKRGEHTLRVSNGFEEREFEFIGLPSPPSGHQVVCTIEPRSSNLTVQALLSGTLEFTVESSVQLNGLELTVEIEASGRRSYATDRLGTLPCTISSSGEPFVTLIDDETRDQFAQVSSLKLRLSIGNLCACTIELERRLRPCWWQQGRDGTIALKGEVGDVEFGWLPVTDPAASPALESVDSLEEARLLVPTDLELSEYGAAAQFTTFCIAPASLSLQAPPIERPRLIRCRRGKNGVLGLEDVVEGYLRWSLAESSTPVAEIRRRQVAAELDHWFTRICCGAQWVSREAPLMSEDPWDMLANFCDEAGFGRDAYIKLSRADEIEITRIAVQEMRLAQPELWARVGKWYELSPEDYEELDLACGRAYTELADHYQKQGRIDIASEIREGDPGAPADDWNTILGQVKSVVEHQPLVEMLFPSECAHRLMALEPSILTLDELAEELTTWAETAKEGFAGRVPPEETLKAVLALWIEPEVAIHLDWRAALDVLLAERSVARAARYMALRSPRRTIVE